jgi:hypothetical protein
MRAAHPATASIASFIFLLSALGLSDGHFGSFSFYLEKRSDQGECPEETCLNVFVYLASTGLQTALHRHGCTWVNLDRQWDFMDSILHPA